MAKYSDQLMAAVAAGDFKKLGVRLGAACIGAGIPVQVVARWLGMSRQGVYFWFLGETEVAERHKDKVEKIMRVLRAAMDAGALPAVNLETTLDVVAKYRSKS